MLAENGRAKMHEIDYTFIIHHQGERDHRGRARGVGVVGEREGGGGV